MSFQTKHDELLAKQEVLNSSRAQLKTEFIGIDRVIDEVIDSIGSWYMFPDLQEKPVVVNLWGLTGVGKSSLVTRLAEVLNFKDKFYHFDLGENGSKYNTVKDKIEEIYENANGTPAILALDEFQHARTINADFREMSTTSRVIWQILDSGKFQSKSCGFNPDRFYEMIVNLRHMLKRGVVVSNGKVTDNKEYYLKNIGHYDIEDFVAPDGSDGVHLYSKVPKDVSFIPTYYHDMIYRLAKDKFQNMYEVSEFLLSMNGHDTVEFLTGIYEQSKHPKIVDCTKSIIFILGNLDEAYTMSHNFNPDMDADEFHAQSLTITVPTIKNALQRRFRSEQIARLGNTHIIYPAFSKETFLKLIELELVKISEKFLERNGIALSFDNSIISLIFKEGVYPTQGTRPVYTTIGRVVSSKLGTAVTEMILKKLDPTGLRLSYRDETVCVEYFHGDEIMHKLDLRQELNLEKLRCNRKDDVQAITAVHESGHAIISAVLMNLFPEYILSTSAGSGSSGLVYAKLRWNFVSRKEILKRLALFMGGYAAEKIVFGEENVTTGAEDDIEKATNFAMEMLKQCGMGEFPVCYHADNVETRDYVYDEKNSLGRLAEQWMQSALELAVNTLSEQETLLLKMSDYLSDNRNMPKEEIKKYFELYGNNIGHLLDASGSRTQFIYRDMLKKRIAESSVNDSLHNIQLLKNCD